MAKAKKPKTKLPQIIAPPPSIKQWVRVHPRKTMGILAGGSLVILLVLAFIVVYDRSDRLSREVACSDQLLQEAAPVLKPEAHTKLKTVVDKVIALKNFDRDPNCLHIVVSYYINITDHRNARMYMDKLEQVYVTTDGFSPQLGKQARSMDEFRANLEFMKKQEDEFKKNLRFKLQEAN